MRRAVLVLMLAIAPCMGLADELRGRVVGVADGDTLTVLDAWRQQIKVRLAEIDAPEKVQPFGQRSRQQLADLCFNQEANIRETARDRFGRTVARVRCQGLDASAEQVKAGMAWAFTRYLTAFQPRGEPGRGRRRGPPRCGLRGGCRREPRARG